MDVTLKDMLEIMRVQRHDFLNHLQVVLGLVQLNKKDKIQEYIRHLSMELDQLGRLIRLSKPEVAAVLLKLNYQAAQEQIKFVFELEDNLDNCSISSELVAEALEILIINITDYLPVSVNDDMIIKFSTWQAENKHYIKISFKDMEQGKENIYNDGIKKVEQILEDKDCKVSVAFTSQLTEIILSMPTKN